MNQENSAAGLVGAALRPRAHTLQLSKAENGWVITVYSQTYVAKTWNEMNDKLKELFAIVD